MAVMNIDKRRQRQCRRRSTNFLLLSLAIILSNTTLLVNALDTDCQPSGSTQPPYTGYSLKTSTSCTQYVYCINGIISSTHKCPDGLLFNGSVGVGGICNWSNVVDCADGNDLGLAFDALTNQGVSQVEETTTTTSSEEQDMVQNLAGSIAESIEYRAEDDGVLLANPHNFYCGSSVDEAMSICKPCPSGTILECKEHSHKYGCFKGIDSCTHGNGDSSPISDSLANKIEEAFDDLPATTTPFTTIQQAAPSAPTYQAASQPSVPTYQASFNVASPATPTVSSTANTQQQQQSIPTIANTVVWPVTGQATNTQVTKPTNEPSLPPWTNAPFNPSPSGSTSKTVIGYYASWQWYDRNKYADPINIQFSKYDRINYAFFQPDLAGNLFGTDEWADPQLLFGPYIYNEAEQTNANYKCSWDGPNIKNCNHHDLSKGIVQLAHSVGTEVMPSIGGWTLSDNFPSIAASATKRERFAQQCVELIVDYDFDGIDLDWEYPGYEDHSGTPDDTVNFTKLLATIRAKLDDLGAATGRFYGLTAALPCGPDKIDKIQVDQIKYYLTELNLMSYDLHGAWDALTGVNAPMFDQGWTDKSKRWSVHGCVNNYVDLGVPLSQMNIGLPFYGRSFQKATGMKQFHDGADDINYHLDEGSPQYFNIVNELGRMTTYRHEDTQTQYAVFNDGDRGLVSYDDARAICDKVGYANERGMHGFLVWEISGDMIDLGDGNMITPLIDATNAKIQNPNFDCSTLRDPTWALSDQTYRYAPNEPDTVDWSLYTAPDTGGSANDFNGAQSQSDVMLSNPAPSPSSGVNTPTYNQVYTSDSTPSNTISSAASSPSDGSSSECPLDYTGYYPVAGCASYVYCTSGSVVGAVLPCVPGTLFDVTISVCAYEANVVCGLASYISRYRRFYM